ncbi:phosphonate C-P lyase system protein PhnH [Pontivivens ytuae]|uniref:Phosphonate C-P lyase system protein PhnH n=1 Tax=Pontivivens ytuae TaxID=2789856 RepID=A0A7S9LNV9_9RHOB|nr:phosphonate C-P lyase system protein PhnH [Pontivivens ytuae]QPH52577.1 phosphonate C-P lyase system protein PhnH [Pontivivens ytuae]
MTALAGGFTEPALEAAQAFRAAMNAMARPGRIEHAAAAQPPAPLSPAAGTLLLTLCDTDTALYLAPGHDTDAIRQWIAFHTGAPIVAAGEADFALGTWAALQPLDTYRIGEPDYPDRSATLIVEVEELEAAGATLTGPGIEIEAQLNLPDPAAFAANARHFPLGFDTFLTCGDRLAAMPRSTRVG